MVCFECCLTPRIKLRKFVLAIILDAGIANITFILSLLLRETRLDIHMQMNSNPHANKNPIQHA